MPSLRDIERRVLASAQIAGASATTAPLPEPRSSNGLTLRDIEEIVNGTRAIARRTYPRIRWFYDGEYHDQPRRIDLSTLMAR